MAKTDRIGNILKTIDNKNYFKDFKNSLENILNSYNKDIRKKNLLINKKQYKGLSQKIKRPKNLVINFKSKINKLKKTKEKKNDKLRSKSSKVLNKLNKKNISKKCQSTKKIIQPVVSIIPKINKKQFSSFSKDSLLGKKFNLVGNSAVKNKNNSIYKSIFNTGKSSDLKMNFFKVIKKNREEFPKKENLKKKLSKTNKKCLKKKTLSKYITTQKKEDFNFQLKKTQIPLNLKEKTASNEKKAQKGEKYYITEQKKSLKSPSSPSNQQKAFIVQFNQTLQSFQFLKRLNLKNHIPNGKKIQLTKASKKQKTLIFDLDETLIHCNEDQSIKSDIKIPITFPTGEKIEAGINIRPFAFEILEQMSEFFEIIIFTASHSCYANPVIDFLDRKKVVKKRLFRDHCSQIAPGLFTKDLRVILGRDLKDVVLVDNAAYSFLAQVYNGVPILPYYKGKKDKELFKLKGFLMGLIGLDDVRVAIRQHFKWDLFLQLEPASIVHNI